MIAKTFSICCFILGCYVAFSFSSSQLAPVLERYKLIPSIVSAEGKALEFSCKEDECVTCLEGIRDTPDAIVFTSGSTFRSALDFDAFSKAMPLPVVNCIKNDSRVDAYRIFFEHAHYNQPGQTIFHGYNSWNINSAGTWTNQAGAFFVLGPPPPPTPVPAWTPAWVRPAARRFLRLTDSANLGLLLANIFLTREMAESPNRWRQVMASDYPSYNQHDVAYWPLSKEEHFRRRLDLMKRSFDVSAYVRSFMIDMDVVRPREEIAARHETFLNAAAPTKRFVFFPAPELTEVFPDHIKKVMKESKDVMLDTLSRHPSVRHVEIDYRACGVEPSDFWKPLALIFDTAHPKPAAMPRITACVVDALKKANIDRFVIGP